MRVIHLNHSDINGGAAIAAYRIHESLLQAGIESKMHVDISNSGDFTVEGPSTKLGKAYSILRSNLGSSIFRPFFKTSNPIAHSPSILPSFRINDLNNSNADILHLHWIQSEMLSIAEIGSLRKNVIWTLHDMWAFCGAEHLSWDNRWRDGYLRNNRPNHEVGFDLNRWTWERKLKHWRNPLHIITPSNWLANCVRESKLMRDWPIGVIPNCINTDKWSPFDQRVSRILLGLPEDVPLLLFGSYGANSFPHKGFDLLLDALKHLKDDSRYKDTELVIFGQRQPKILPDLGFRIHYTGHLHDEISMRLLYCAVDVMAIPSRQDNLPNTGLEAQACGTPVVAFAIGGLTDIVSHNLTGYLAKPFDTISLANGIAYVISQRNTNRLRNFSRQRAIDLFSMAKVSEAYHNVYTQILK